MKKSLIALLIVLVVLSIGATVNVGAEKVYVCKYVGTPGVDEELQTGQNPIEISVNAIGSGQWDGVTVPAWFNDTHNRSYVLGFVPMDPKPTVADCPLPEPFIPPDPITQTIYLEPNCDGVMAQDQEAVWVGGPDGGYGPWVDVGDPYQVHEWTNPYEVEDWTAPDQSVIDEPADCQIFRTYKAHQAYLKDNCEGIVRVINLYEGPASDPYQTLVGTFYYEIFLFTDPLILETIPPHVVDVPSEYGPDYTFAAMDEPEICYTTCALDVFSRSWTEETLTPEGTIEVTTFFEYVDSLNPEVVCRVTEEVEVVYESCLNAESTYEVPGIWSDWYDFQGTTKERNRTVEIFDSETDFKCGEYVDYDQECFADDFIWVWQGCGCSIRDRTYELYHFGSPPLAAQRAYCGCDFSCMDEGAWNDSGYVNNCQGEDYTFWDELPKWCGFTSCE